MFWKRFDSKELKGEGILIEGNPKVWKSRWWNYLLLVAFLWKRVCVLRVHAGDSCYRLAYVRGDGVCKIYRKPIYGTIIRVGVRHEGHHFFAIDEKGNGIDISIVDQDLDLKDNDYAGMLLV